MNWKLLNKIIPPNGDLLRFKGYFQVDVFRAGRLIKHVGFKNAVTTVGKNGIFDWAFRNQANPANWYIGLIDATGFASTAVTDTMAAHPNWAEFDDYTEATRESWTPGAAANGQITNPVPAEFNINATGSVRGIFITSDNVKLGVAGTLWTTGLFPTALSVVNTDQVKITYTVAA
jgi:hypothetical protein